MTVSKEQALLTMVGLDINTLNSDNTKTVFDELLKTEEILAIIDDYKKHIRTRLFELAESYGEKDEKGSFTVELPDGSWFKKEARTSVNLNVDKILEMDKVKNYPFVKGGIELVVPKAQLEEIAGALKQQYNIEPEYQYSIDEDELYQAYLEDIISDDEFKEMLDKKVTFALKKKGI